MHLIIIIIVMILGSTCCISTTTFLPGRHGGGFRWVSGWIIPLGTTQPRRRSEMILHRADHHHPCRPTLLAGIGDPRRTSCRKQFPAVPSGSDALIRTSPAGTTTRIWGGFSDSPGTSHYSPSQHDDPQPPATPKRSNAPQKTPRPYWEDDSYVKQKRPDDEENSNRRDDGSETWRASSSSRGRLTWETCTILDDEGQPTGGGVAHVLLPPPQQRVDPIPTAILHVVGGTWFGSAPQFWYRRLLEDVVRQAHVAVVATAIPIRTGWGPAASPLQHVAMARTLQTLFRAAYEQILMDEYDPNLLQQVPIGALGHSLGARLLVVLATLPSDPRRAVGRPGRSLTYSSMILISFTNHAAAAGIPGILQLKSVSQQLERQSSTEEQERRRAREGSGAQRRRRRDGRHNSDRYGDPVDDDEDDEDEYNDEWEDASNWNELLQEVQSSLRQQVVRVQRALTPPTEALEFYPSPDQLWRALAEDGRYRIRQTLLVQFDDDELDQSAKLALALKNSTQLRFARLRGTHLTPVSTITRRDSNEDNLARLVGKILSRQAQDHVRDLGQSLVRYVTEIVTKPDS